MLLQTEEGRQGPTGFFDRKRDERFEREVVSHLSAAYNLARWILADAHDAEDAVQDSVVKAIRRQSTYAGGDAKAWFLAIVRNTCMNVLRVKSRRAVYEVDSDEELESVATNDANPDAILLRSVDANRLRSAIEELPPPLREVIVLREIEQLSYAEIAQVIEVPIGTVMSRLARSRSRLRDALGSEVNQ